MKKYLFLLLCTMSLTSQAQFPAPTNFQFTYVYIHLFSSGYCDGTLIYGPAYCSHFSWDQPDTSLTSAKLDHYNLYYLPNGDTNVQLVISQTGLTYTVVEGFMGYLWVTAVYKNPNGESDSSNIIFNPTLPIGISQNNEAENIEFYFDKEMNSLVLKPLDKIDEINIFDLFGRLVISQKIKSEILQLADLSSGVYIIQIHTKNNLTVNKRFVY